MKSIRLSILAYSVFGLFLLGACSSNQNNPTATESPSVQNTEVAPKAENTAEKPDKDADHSQESRGGQVVEVGDYHLELVKEKEENGDHLHFYLQKGADHQLVTNAKVTALVQSPDGGERSLNLVYESEEKAYTGTLNDADAGKYNLKIIAEVAGEKVNGRFQIE
jgi:hypothetical protein